MVNATNVVSLQQNSVYQDIVTFLNDMETKSVNTRKNYERSIRNFFMFMRNTHIEQLSVDDLKFRNADMKNYRRHLLEQYSNVTVNSYMSAITSLYDFFETNEYPVKAKVMKLDQLSDDSQQYGTLSTQEAEMMAQLAKNQVKGQEKSALIRLAYTTSFRKNTLLNIEWEDIVHLPDQNLYEVRVITKGKKKHERPISEDLYNELLKIKKQKYYERYGDNKVFHLSNQAIQDMMDRIKEEMGMGEERNIVFHSFRNVLPGYIKETSGDVFEIKKQLGHSNINTSMRYLKEDDHDYSSSAGIQIETKIDESIFDELSHEELLSIVRGFGNGIGMQLRMAAKKIVDAR